LILYAPFPYASVLPSSVLMIESAAVILLLLSLYLRHINRNPDMPYFRIPCLYPVLGLMVLAVVQVSPLPASLISLVSPQSEIFRNLSHNEYLGNILMWLSQKSGTALKISSFFPNHTISIYPYAGWLKALWLLAMGMLCFALIYGIRSKREIRFVLVMVIISGTVQALLYLISYLRGVPLLARWYGYEMKRVGGMFVNRDHFSAYMSMIIPVLASWIFYHSYMASHSRRTRMSRVATFLQGGKGLIPYMSVMLIIMAIGQLFSLSRAGIGSCLVSLGILLYLTTHGVDKMKITTILLLILIAVVTLVYWIGYYPIVERFKLIPKDFIAPIGRGVVWQDSFTIIKDFPVTGVGLANFSNAFVHYKRFSDIRYTYAHNDILQFMVEMGITGFVILILIVFCFYRQVLKYPWQSYSRTRALVLGMTAGTIALVIHSFFDFPLQIPANALLLALYTGLIFSYCKIDTEERFLQIKEKQQAKHIMEKMYE
jgi:O-antigen ligase